MNTSLPAEEFFRLWVDACNQRHEILWRDYRNPPLHTAHVLTDDQSVIRAIAGRMELECCLGYYSIDAVLFKNEDCVPNTPKNTTWIRRIRVAFEHENYFNSGLFQEVSHLLITDCDLRVLVSYPEKDDDLNHQLKYLHKIIAGSDRSKQISDASSFLFIVDVGNNCFEWKAYLYRSDDWHQIPKQPL